MKIIKHTCILFTFVSGLLSLSSANEPVEAISQSDAARIVKAQEEAKERAKDEREAELRGAVIIGTAVTDLGHKKVILNRVRPESAVKPEVIKAIGKEANFDDAAFFSAETKEHRSFTLSGEVRDGISELWWTFEGHQYKIFTNGNFLYFSGIGDFEDADTKYSVFSIVTEGNKRPAVDVEGNGNDEWQPTREDFTPGQLEYYIVKSSGVEEIDAEALQPITIMLEFYRENLGRIKVSYETAQKMRIARDAYLEVNPRKKRDVIINSAPIDKSARKAISE